MDKLKAIETLEKFFAYDIEKFGNSHGYEVIVWNEYGLSLKAKGGSLEETVSTLADKIKNGEDFR